MISSYLKVYLILTGLNVCQNNNFAYTSSLVHSFQSFSYIQLNARAYCMMFDRVVLFYLLFYLLVHVPQ